MSTAEKQEPTPPHVAKHATRPARLDRLALIGIFGTDTARAALIRDRNGTVQRVTVGDKVANRTVTAIGEDRVILTRGNQSSMLSLPET